MKAKFFMYLLVCFGLLNSCSRDEGKEVFVHEGVWSGQYASDVDNGNWSMRIDMNKTVIGTFTSIQSSNSYQIIGTISENGVLSATIQTSEIIGEFSGNFYDNFASGLYMNNSEEDSGSWTGLRL